VNNKILEQLKNGLIVSCQALENEPLHSPYIMSKMALAAKEGGAVGIRANSVVDIKAIKEVVDLPVIGLIKKDYPNSGIFITPTMKEIKELIESGVEIIALDATLRTQADGVSLEEKLKYIHDNNTLAMADISTYEEGMNAAKLGFDLISTTLSGYTNYSTNGKGPDVELVERLVKDTKDYKSLIVAEGKIFSEDDLKSILEAKPFAVVIGSAITRPQVITARYNEIVKSFNLNLCERKPNVK